MADAEDHHWWFVGTRDVIVDVLRHALGRSPRGLELLDAGCGSGYTLARMRAEGFEVTGCDASAVALERARQRGIQNLHAAELPHLPFADDAFDVVICLDVLEHIERDDEAAAELHRVLAPDGVGIIAVPAWPRLFGPHDVALGHVRRYDRNRLRKVLTGAGFSVETLTYYNSLLSPLVAAVRLWERWRGGEPQTDVHLPPSWLNTMLHKTLSSERWLLRRASLPVGISLLAVVTRH